MSFETAVERTLSHEGGYVNNPKDPGGETKWGISKKQYPNVDIAGLSREDAIAIYKRDFWGPFCAGLKDPVAFQVFDAGVNHGVGNAVRMLQDAVGVAPDGHWGPVSQAKYDATPTGKVLLSFLGSRLRFMTKLTTFSTFGGGWSARVAEDLLLAAQDL